MLNKKSFLKNLLNYASKMGVFVKMNTPPSICYTTNNLLSNIADSLRGLFLKLIKFTFERKNENICIL